MVSAIISLSKSASISPLEKSRHHPALCFVENAFLASIPQIQKYGKSANLLLSILPVQGCRLAGLDRLTCGETDGNLHQNIPIACTNLP